MTHIWPDSVVGFDSRFWNGVLPAGVPYKFYIAKCSEGTWVSPDFANQYRAAQQGGLARSAWSYHRYASDAVASARAYHNAMLAAGGYGELPPVLDAEDMRAPVIAAMFDHIWVQLQEMEQLSGREVLVYTANWWWNRWCKPFSLPTEPMYTRKLWEADPEPDTTEPSYWDKSDLVLIQTRLDFNPGGFNAVIDEDVAKREWFESLVGPLPDTVTITIAKSTADDLRRALA